MKEDEPNCEQQNTDFFEYLRKKYPSDNELGFDVSKFVGAAEDRQETIRKREVLDIKLKESGRKLRVARKVA